MLELHYADLHTDTSDSKDENIQLLRVSRIALSAQTVYFVQQLRDEAS